MTKQLITFTAAFIVGCIMALVVRTALHRPAPAPAGTVTVPAKPVAAAVAAHDPAAHDPAVVGTPVNTLCAICGMEVDPDLPTARYKDKVVGFGCKACPPKFAADPERYGPSALRNEKAQP